MYIPEINRATDREEIIAFMQQFSFATIVTAKDNVPIATHLPFLVSLTNDNIVLTSHFAKANEQWRHIENNTVLVIFSEPHAYISPTHYDKTLNVPTWNYIAVHAYGQGHLISDTESVFKLLENTIDNYETSYKHQWEHLPADYKLNLSKGIVAFDITVTELQANKKLSQNKSETEKQKIIDSLSKSNNSNERFIAGYMKKEQGG